MKVEKIREITVAKNIKVSRSKKTELVRSIQHAEDNNRCFDTGSSDFCGQNACSWREDCDCPPKIKNLI